MATTTVNLKRNDTRPYLDATLTDEDGTVVDLAGAGVTFTMVDAASRTSMKIENGECTILTSGGADGRVRYSWAGADTNTAGAYLGEFEVTFDDTSKLTVPTTDILVINILEDYNAD
jgi:hypothetical protein